MVPIRYAYAYEFSNSTVSAITNKINDSHVLILNANEVTRLTAEDPNDPFSNLSVNDNPIFLNKTKNIVINNFPSSDDDTNTKIARKIKSLAQSDKTLMFYFANSKKSIAYFEPDLSGRVLSVETIDNILWK